MIGVGWVSFVDIASKQLIKINKHHKENFGLAFYLQMLNDKYSTYLPDIKVE